MTLFTMSLPYLSGRVFQSIPEYSRTSWVRFSLGARNLFPKKSKTEANVTNLRLSQAMPQVWIGALACEHSRPVILKLVWFHDVQQG